MNDHHTSSSATPLSFSQQQEIDRLCTDFEAQWRSRQRPQIEDVLAQVAATLRSDLLRELIATEVELRQAAGEPLAIEEYYQRFPDDAGAVKAGWALIAHREQREALDPGPASTVNLSRDVDLDTGGDRAGVPHDALLPIPATIGRYEIRAVLGEGGFGRVYRAYDPQLQRDVALKVPGRQRLASAESIETFLQEARAAARLKHAGLVVVYDVQQDGADVYIVQEYFDGQDLGAWARAHDPTPEQLVRLLRQVVEAVGFAHQHNLIHRDLKPANLLVDQHGHPHVADFGLALNESIQRLRKGEVCGTPAYMSPEQVRGMAHVLDGRSDLWSIGVVFYELLTGRRPFGGASHAEIFEEVKRRDPKPPRQIKPEIPAELERICLKCLQKRQTDRYASAAEMLEDLDAWLRQLSPVAAASSPVGAGVGEEAIATTPTGSPAAGSTAGASDTRSDKQPASRIVPKGLRSFDEHDADFFLELLPGPRDREGLPESIRFWKTRLEEVEEDATFSVGVMYGPAGCGKSSLVKAGLLPHLAAHVLPVFVEATPNDTELRLLKQLRKRVPRLSAEASLAEALAQLREGRVTDGRKVVLLLDQFEQWLHAAGDLDSSQLVPALRQCDGAHVQGLILVRDNVWLTTTRFMQALGIPQVEGFNSAQMDLFDPTHARKVLRAFGLAYGRLPEHDLSAEQQRFLDRAVQELAHDGKVIGVQLSLFAEMMKGRPWKPASLQGVGGMSGVRLAFLDETFTAKTAPPTHRLHATGAQAVLNALVPEVCTDVKGQMQPVEHLREVSGYANRPEDYRSLLQILDAELRLITPTDPEADNVSTSDNGAAGPVSGVWPPISSIRYYQLTHDHLVPSLRDWLTRKQKETRRGRAELRLAERSAIWRARPEYRHLPPFWEYLNIRFCTRSRDWTWAQNAMMRRAGVVHMAQWSLALSLLLAVGLGLGLVRALNLEQRVQDAVTAISNSRSVDVQRAIEELKAFPRWIVTKELEGLFSVSEETRQLPLAYALADPAFGQVNRSFLIQAIATAPAEECDNIVTALAHDCELALEDVRSAAATATAKQDWKCKTRLAAVALYLGDTTIATEMLQADSPLLTPPLELQRRTASPLNPNWTETFSSLAAAVGWYRPQAGTGVGDPMQRTMFIECFSQWSGNVEKLVPVLEPAKDPSLLSGMSLALGSISEVTTNVKRTWEPRLARWYLHHPHGGVHSASGWALRSWGLTVPTIAPKDTAEKEYDWQVTQTGLTLIRIPAGQVERPESNEAGEPRKIIRIDREFWLSDREITAGQFLAFLDDLAAEIPADADQTARTNPGRQDDLAAGILDHSHDIRQSNTGDPARPAVDVSWYYAVVFCNWLSGQEGREPSYRKERKEQIRQHDNTIREYDAWHLIPEANGYRLPTEDEWEYACRAETTTAFSFGDDEDLLERHGVYTRDGRFGPNCVAGKLCNAWGLFDMHGNVWEWCQDWHQEGTDRVYRGGSWLSPASLCRSAYRGRNRPNSRHYSLGFRVATFRASK